MIVLRQAAILNNVGLLLLEVGNYDRAIENFMAAMNIMSCPSQQDYAPYSSMDHAAMSVQSEPQCVTARDPIIAHKSYQNAFYIYSRAIELDPAQDGQISLQENLRFSSAVVSFNTALAYQLLGIRMNSKVGYTKAKEFYEICLILLDEFTLYSDHAKQLIVTTLNNQSHVQHELGDSDEVEETLELMLALMSCLYVSGGGTGPDVITEFDLKEFHLNSMIASYCSAASCA